MLPCLCLCPFFLPLTTPYLACFFLHVHSLFQASHNYASRIMAAFVCRLIIVFEFYPNTQKLILFFHLQLDKSWKRQWPSLGHVPIRNQSLSREMHIFGPCWVTCSVLWLGKEVKGLAVPKSFICLEWWKIWSKKRKKGGEMIFWADKTILRL